MSLATTTPHVIVVAGPNGAGKSTAAPELLKRAWAIAEFVNADTIAAGLSAFQPETVAVVAGRIMLRRMRSLAASRESFAFETTLAARSFAPWLKDLKRGGYHVHVQFLWLRDADLAVHRVAERVRLGGHAVAERDVRRRYEKGLVNFFRLYRPLADTWQFFDNSSLGPPRLVAEGDEMARVRDDLEAWRSLTERYSG